MRPLTDAQSLILTKPDRATHVKVLIGSVNMSDLEGYNWVKRVIYQGSLDNNVTDASIELFTRMEKMSLAPLMSGSKFNVPTTMITLGAAVTIYTATVAHAQSPVDSDWVMVFQGQIDVIDWQSTPMVLKCRDKGGILVDRFIETQQVYPADLLSPANPKLEAVIQAILDNTFGSSIVELFSVNGTAITPFNPTDSPGFLINQYVQQKQTVMQALRVLVDQIGWSIRYLWQANTAEFELVLYDTGRELSSIGYMALTGQPSIDDYFTIGTTDFYAKATPTTNQFAIGSTVAETADNIRAMLEVSSIASDLVVWRGQQRARGTITFTDNPLNDQIFTINSTVYTAKTASPDATQHEYLIGATKEETVDNIVDIIRYSPENINLVVWHETSGSDALLRVEWRGPPVDEGMAVVFTEGLSNATIDSGPTPGTLGGTQAGQELVFIMWATRGTAGNSIDFDENMANTTLPNTPPNYLKNYRAGRGVSVDRTFSKSEYTKISNLSVSRADIRNVVEVTFGRFADDRTTVVVDDALSIAAYGRRWCGIDENATSQIDTETEATEMATAVLDDLKEPDVTQSVELPYFWPVEVGDLYTFLANGYHYDTDIDLAVVSWAHSIDEKSAKTTLSLRGKPAGGVARWLNLETRGGVGGLSNTYTQYKGVAPRVDPDIASFTLQYDDPRSMDPPINDWSYIEIHLSTTSAFTPSKNTLAARGRETKFTISGLAPGTTYYIKSRVIDSAGNKHDLGTQIQKATRKITPYYLSEEREYGLLIPNQEFGVYTLDSATNMPDYWSDIVSEYGVSIFRETTLQLTGGSSLHFDVSLFGGGGSVGWEIQTDYIPVTQDSLYAIDLTFRYAGTSKLGDGINIGLFVFSADKGTSNFLNVKAISLNAATAPHFYQPNTWYQARARGLIPSNVLAAARHMKVRVSPSVSSGSSLTDIYLDRCRMYRDYPECEINDLIVTNVPPSTWTKITFDTTVTGFDYGGNFDTVTNHHFVAPTDGQYRIEYEGKFASILTNGTAHQRRIVKIAAAGTTYVHGPYMVAPNGQITHAPMTTMLSLLRGDTVHVEAWHNDSVARNVQGRFKARLIEYAGD
jgi:hypothetical protein